VNLRSLADVRALTLAALAWLLFRLLRFIVG
jgi:hypothetical protein